LSFSSDFYDDKGDDDDLEEDDAVKLSLSVHYDPPKPCPFELNTLLRVLTENEDWTNPQKI